MFLTERAASHNRGAPLPPVLAITFLRNPRKPRTMMRLTNEPCN